MTSALTLEEEKKDVVTWVVAREVDGIFDRATRASGPSRSGISDIKSNNMELQVDQGNAHEEGKYVAEDYEVYNTADTGEVVEGTVQTTAAVAVGEVIVTDAVLGTAVVAAAPLVFVGGLVMIAGGLVYNGVQWVRQKNADCKLSKKQLYNNLIKEYNEKRKEYIEIGARLIQNKRDLHDQLVKIENEMKHCEEDLLKQRYDLNGKIIMLVGPTGFGKSTVARRLIGNTLDCDENQEDSLTNKVFAVGQEGKLKSQTKNLESQRKGIEINGKYMYNLSVIDTPGAFDTEGQTAEFCNNMSEYMIQIGGINMFALVFKYGSKLDENYQNLLKMYQEFWEDLFWTNCAIFITYCDRDSQKNIRKIEKGLQATKEGIKKFLNSKLGLDARDVNKIPIFEFGESNFEQSVVKIMITLADKTGAFGQKYECKTIKSPIKKTWDQIGEIYQKYQLIGRELVSIKTKMNCLKNQF